MKLFELFDSVESRNLDAISKAIAEKTSARITLGERTFTINNRTAKAIYNMFEQARIGGYYNEFVNELEKPSATLAENEQTFTHILSRFPKEVKDFKAGGDMHDDLFHALYDYYAGHGEMPYGTMKARDGDPYEWVSNRLADELGLGELAVIDGAKEPVIEGPNDPDELPPELIDASMFENVKRRGRPLEVRTWVENLSYLART